MILAAEEDNPVDVSFTASDVDQFVKDLEEQTQVKTPYPENPTENLQGTSESNPHPVDQPPEEVPGTSSTDTITEPADSNQDEYEEEIEGPEYILGTWSCTMKLVYLTLKFTIIITKHHYTVGFPPCKYVYKILNIKMTYTISK